MSITKALETKLAQVKGLPSPPRIAMQIIEAARDPDISLAGVADVITSDPVISAKVLRMANSAAYTVRGGCATLRRALLTLGLDATLVIALSFSLVVSLKRDKTAGLDHEYFWRRSLLSAAAANALGRAMNRTDSETLFLAGLLQDIGMLALDKCEPGLYAENGDLVYDHRALSQHEVAQLGCSHADVGQWLLTRWQLPAKLVDAVARSHDAMTAEDDEFQRCAALSGPLADVWLSSDWSRSFGELVAMAAEYLAVDETRLSIVLDELREQIPETEAMFEKDLLDPLAGMRAMEEARELLMERGIQGILADLQEVHPRVVAASEPLQRLQRWIELGTAVEKEFAGAVRAGADVGVIIAGLAGLNHVRETHGGETADRLLHESARAILSVAEAVFIAQYSHNEIVVWLADCDHYRARLTGRRVLGEIQRVLTEFSGEYGTPVSLALGIAAQDRQHSHAGAADLVAAAQAALESARFGTLATADDACVVPKKSRDKTQPALQSVSD